MKNVDIARQVLAFLTAKMGGNLNASIWNAKRNDSGTKTKELFNGFDTITKTEKDAAKISTDLGNMFTIEAISKDNAVDVLKHFTVQLIRFCVKRKLNCLFLRECTIIM